MGRDHVGIEDMEDAVKSESHMGRRKVQWQEMFGLKFLFKDLKQKTFLNIFLRTDARDQRYLSN